MSPNDNLFVGLASRSPAGVLSRPLAGCQNRGHEPAAGPRCSGWRRDPDPPAARPVVPARRARAASPGGSDPRLRRRRPGDARGRAAGRDGEPPRDTGVAGRASRRGPREPPCGAAPEDAPLGPRRQPGPRGRPGRPAGPPAAPLLTGADRALRRPDRRRDLPPPARAGANLGARDPAVTWRDRRHRRAPRRLPHRLRPGGQRPQGGRRDRRRGGLQRGDALGPGEPRRPAVAPRRDRRLAAPCRCASPPGRRDRRERRRRVRRQPGAGRLALPGGAPGPLRGPGAGRYSTSSAGSGAAFRSSW